MKNVIFTYRSSNISWVLHEQNSLYVKFNTSDKVYQYDGFDFNEFNSMKQNSDNDSDYSLGSYISLNVVKRYGRNFRTHSIIEFINIQNDYDLNY